MSANLASLLARTARNWPRLPAVASGGGVLHDYATLARRAAALARSLQRAGLQTGDRVALVSRNVPAFIEALFACWWAGLVAVPVNAKLHPKELAFVLHDSGARFAFVDDAWHAAMGAMAADVPGLTQAVLLGGREHEALAAGEAGGDPVPVATADAAWLFYTSGTTGRPRGSDLAREPAGDGAVLLCDVEAIAPGDAILHPAPLSHGSGLYVVPHVARAAVNVVPESGGFDPDEIFALLGTWQRSLFFAAPTMVKRLVDAPVRERAARPA